MNKCEDCKHEEICKWCGEMERNKEAVSHVAICKGLTPIKIEVICRKFEKDIARQENLCTQRQYL